jgi:hypothetical protein
MYNWWMIACRNLNIEGVDLYGGTRHSTASALGNHFSKEELREFGTMHASNKAFERYVQNERDKSIRVYEKVQEMKEGRVIDIKQGKGKSE